MDRQKIFIAYCFPDKKWLDRIQPVLTELALAPDIVVWDERKLRTGKLWRKELPEILAESKMAVMMVSDLFLESDFMNRVNLPARLAEERARGLRDCWVLATHCRYETANLDETLAVNDLDRPFDALNSAQREAVVAEIGCKLRELAGVAETPVPVNPPATTQARKTPKRPSATAEGATLFPVPPPPRAPEPEPKPDPEPPSPPSPFVRELGEIIEARRQNTAELRRLARAMIFAALAVIAVSLIAVAYTRSLSLLLMIAGFGVFIGAMVFALRRRMDFLSQSIVGMRYVRTGLGDDTLPDRQRSALTRKAHEILGKT